MLTTAVTILVFIIAALLVGALIAGILVYRRIAKTHDVVFKGFSKAQKKHLGDFFGDDD